MIYWAPFLHFYQPSIQFHAVLRKICEKSYRPLLKVFFKHTQAKVTVNICAGLTDLLIEHNYCDIIEGLKGLAQNNQLEFVDSAKFHAILPLIPKSEIYRQIKLNRETNKKVFKDAYKVRGFFPPEMCYCSYVGRILKELGYEWVLVSGIANQGPWPLDFICGLKEGRALKIFYRDDILSNKISFRNLDAAAFLKELKELAKGKKDIYLITAMDAETFGHHIKSWQDLFLAEVFRIISDPKTKDTAEIKIVTISELLEKFPVEISKPPRPSSWSTSKEDLSAKNYYPLWKDPHKRIHNLQWEHLALCWELVRQSQKITKAKPEVLDSVNIARSIFDKALFSCQFWWANKNKGLWSVNLINKGLILQEEAILNAYQAIQLSSLNSPVKESFYYKLLISRHIAAKVRDLLIE